MTHSNRRRRTHPRSVLIPGWSERLQSITPRVPCAHGYRRPTDLIRLCIATRGPCTDIATPQGCMLLFLGRLADLFGRKLTFIAGCVAMGVFGLGCGFAQGMSTFFRSFLPMWSFVASTLWGPCALCGLSGGTAPCLCPRSSAARQTACLLWSSVKGSLHCTSEDVAGHRTHADGHAASVECGPSAAQQLRPIALF